MGVEFRRLGRSGLTISEIAYGNWLTHGSQVEEDAAHACVHAALDAGITTFDTADVYAATKAESVLGRALKGTTFYAFMRALQLRFLRLPKPRVKLGQELPERY